MQSRLLQCRIAARLAALFAGGVLLQACSGSALLLANSLATLDDYTLHEDIAYGEASAQRLDVYIPGNTSRAALAQPGASAVIVFFYGGCWGACLSHYKQDYAFVAQAFTAQGYVVVIPNYRHYPQVRYAEIMQDAARATHWVQQHINEYEGDSSRIVLAGHSAGAHLAAMLTLDETWLDENTQNSIRGFIGLAGPYDFLPFTEAYQPALFGPESNYPKSQPVNYVDGDEAPLLLLYGNDDTRVKPVNIEGLSRAVHNAGGRVEPHRYDGIDHAGILAALSRPLRERKPVMADIHRFLVRVLAPPAD
jgi:acetyl esterase/lipase